MNRAAAIVIFPCIAVALPRPAFAYRPFDSTDAAVAEKGDLELELGPLGFLKTDAGRFLVAPSAIFNLGIARDWELVLQGRHFILLDGMAGDSRFRLIDTGLFLKGVLREGSLQEVHGPSVAIEVGPLLPTINGEPGIGATATLIVSQHWKPVTLHVNGEVTLTRAGNLDLFGGAILEGPREWAVRPVVEAFVEREFGGAFVLSGLVGAIWQLKEGLSLDIALRAARVDTNTALEVRAGLTCATSLWRSQ